MPNPIGHFEICVSNLEEGKEFYSKLFEWDIHMDSSMPGYALANTSKEPGGGIFQAEGEMKPFVTIYVEVDDIDGVLAKAESMGAMIIAKKTKISDEHGYYGMFADPDKNVIGLWSRT